MDIFLGLKKQVPLIRILNVEKHFKSLYRDYQSGTHVSEMIVHDASMSSLRAT